MQRFCDGRRAKSEIHPRLLKGWGGIKSWIMNPLGFVGGCGSVETCRNAFQSIRMFAMGDRWFVARVSRYKRSWSFWPPAIPPRTCSTSIPDSRGQTFMRAWITPRESWVIISRWSRLHDGFPFGRKFASSVAVCAWAAGGGAFFRWGKPNRFPDLGFRQEA